MKNTARKLLSLLLACSTCLFYSCGSDDDERNEGGLQNNFINVENSTYVKGGLPVGSNSNMLVDVTLDESVLPGGSSYLKLTSKEVLKTAYITVSGEEGYLKVDLKQDNVPGRSVQTYTYTVVISLSQQLKSNFTIELTTVNSAGDISTKFSQSMTYIEAGIGDLQVNLHFSNAKDLDLYVVEPNGNIICYARPFPYNSDAFRRFQEYIEGDEDFDEEDFPEFGKLGLDVDSNAGCEIDNINSENIFFKSENIQKGKYQVWVNMYENCNSTIATDYIVKATYKGKAVTPTFGKNPGSGTFPIGAPSNDIGAELTNATKIIEFVINEGVTVRSIDASPKKSSLKSISQSARNKLMQSKAFAQ